MGLSSHGLPRTFSYILRELPKVPTHVPVCVLGNYRDMGEHRVVLPDDVHGLIDSLNRCVLLAPRCVLGSPPRPCPPAPVTRTNVTCRHTAGQAWAEGVDSMCVSLGTQTWVVRGRMAGPLCSREPGLRTKGGRWFAGTEWAGRGGCVACPGIAQGAPG